MSFKKQASSSPHQKRSAPKEIHYFHAGHQTALQLDVQILLRMLKANGAAQRRTKYFQRLDMCIRTCLDRKYQLGQLWDDYRTVAQEITVWKERTEKQKKRAEVFWDFAPLLQAKKEGNTPDNPQTDTTEDNPQSQEQLISSKIQNLHQRLTQGIPEAISRLEFASEAFFQQMARGFFLPVCSIAVAALARIRILLISLGREILRAWETNGWTKLVQSTQSNRKDNSPLGDLQQLKQFLRHATGTGVGVENHRSSTTTAKQQALDLVAELLEGNASHQRTKNIDVSSLLLSSTRGDDDARHLDVGERIVSSTGIVATNNTDNEPVAPDYMKAAIDQVQKNVKLTKKAKGQKRKAMAASATSADTASSTIKISDTQASSVPKIAVAEKESQNSTTTAGTITKTSKPNKEKKKKRKESSSKDSKSSKKKKSSGDFFDSLFRK